jgi:hypothetical protein
MERMGREMEDLLVLRKDLNDLHVDWHWRNVGTDKAHGQARTGLSSTGIKQVASDTADKQTSAVSKAYIATVLLPFGEGACQGAVDLTVTNRWDSQLGSASGCDRQAAGRRGLCVCVISTGLS